MVKAIDLGPIVLDSEGLSRLIRRDPHMIAVAELAYQSHQPLVVSAATVMETVSARTPLPGLRWTMSRLNVIPLDEKLAFEAAKLLAAAGRHGHEAALDAAVVATAQSLGHNVTVYTSDPDDIQTLATSKIAVVNLT